MSAHAVSGGGRDGGTYQGACSTTYIVHACARMQTHVRALTQSLMLPSCSMSSFAPDLHVYLTDLRDSYICIQVGAPCTMCLYCIHARGTARTAGARIMSLTLRSPARRRRWQRHRRSRGARTASSSPRQTHSLCSLNTNHSWKACTQFI